MVLPPYDEPQEGANQGHRGLVSVLAPDATGKPAAAHLDRAQEQHDTEGEFRELQRGRKERDVRQNETFDQPGSRKLAVDLETQVEAARGER